VKQGGGVHGGRGPWCRLRGIGEKAWARGEMEWRQSAREPVCEGVVGEETGARRGRGVGRMPGEGPGIGPEGLHEGPDRVARGGPSDVIEVLDAEVSLATERARP